MEDLEAQVNTSSFLSCSSITPEPFFWFVVGQISLLNEEATAIRQYCFYERLQQCLQEVSGTFQSNIHMLFPSRTLTNTSHCFCSLPSSYSAAWWQVSDASSQLRGIKENVIPLLCGPVLVLSVVNRGQQYCIKPHGPAFAPHLH